MKQQSNRGFGRAIAVVVVAACLLALAWAWINRVDISTRIDAMNYTAPKKVARIESRIGLNERGKYLFRASHPTLDGSKRFNDQCHGVDRSDGGHLLGCFTTEGSIHLFEVHEKSLDGIVEVTAAHELMHAAWARLPQGERDRLVDGLRRWFHSYSKDHPDFAKRMKVYGSLPKESFANELHSVCASEVEHLPDWLEQHYAHWFADRSVVVKHFQRYHSVFESLQNQADSLQKRMRALRGEVERDAERYTTSVTVFNRDVQAFNARNDRYEFADHPDQFEREASALRARREELIALYDSLKSRAQEYEQMRASLQKLSKISAGLEASLNNDLPPVTDTPLKNDSPAAPSPAP